MDDLEKNVRLEWFTIREKAEDIYALEEVFEYAPEELRDIAQKIRMAVEGGIIEYKRSGAAGAFTFIDGFRYDARGFERLSSRCRDLQPVLYVTLIQRLIALGKIRKPKSGPDSHDDEAIPGGGDLTSSSESTGTAEIQDTVSSMDIKTIVEEVNERIKGNSDLRAHPAVKTIFLQVKVYQRELAEMNKLRPNIPPEKIAAFAANFKKTFDEITRKVREHYRAMVAEEIQAETTNVHRPPLEAVDITQVAGILFNQASQLSAICTTMTFAGKERYKVGTMLTWAAQKHDPLMALYEEEAKKYSLLRPFADEARELSRAFGNEVIRILERRASRDETM